MAKLVEIITNLRVKVRQTQLPPELEAKVTSMLEEAERISAGSLEALPHFERIANYVAWITELPWNIHTQDQIDLSRAQEILNKNHYGLEPVKDRILEYLAVLKLQIDQQAKGEKNLCAHQFCVWWVW